MSKKVVLVTGASGFLGSHLSKTFEDNGWEVRRLVRNPRDPSELKCSLPREIQITAFKEPIDALVHCAYELRNTKTAYQSNVEGTKNLFEMSRRHNVKKFVFISSMSAHEEAESTYGRSKFELEKIFDPDRDLVIRPGLIIGKGGMYSRLEDSIRNVPVIPLFYGGEQRIQTIAVQDLCTGIFQAVDKNLKGRLSLAEETPVTLKEFYGTIAKKQGLKRTMVNLPAGFFLRAAKISENLGAKLPITSENLLGLKALRTFDVKEDLERVGITPRTMAESIHSL